MQRKYFTLHQAQVLLPEVNEAVRKLVRMKKAIDLLDSVEIEFDEYHYENNLAGLQINKKYHALSHGFYQLLIAIEQEGCIVKDLDIGLVDFYSKHDGRDILLCWRSGEKDIQYWHEEEDGYSARKSISLLKKKQNTNINS